MSLQCAHQKVSSNQTSAHEEPTVKRAEARAPIAIQLNRSGYRCSEPRKRGTPNFYAGRDCARATGGRTESTTLTKDSLSLISDVTVERT